MVVDDLVQHVSEKRRRAIMGALQLLEDDDEILAFLFAVVAADVASLVNSLAVQEEAFPRFNKLSPTQKSFAVTSAICSILTRTTTIPTTPKAVADLVLAQKEISPRIAIAIR